MISKRKKASRNLSNTITLSGSTPLSIARDPAPSGYFDGQLDEFKVWDYALSVQQVLTEFNGGPVRFGQ